MTLLWLIRALLEKRRAGVPFAAAAGARKELLIPGIPLFLLLEGLLLALIWELSVNPAWVVVRRGSLVESEGLAGLLAVFYLVFSVRVGVMPLVRSYLRAPKERRLGVGLFLVGVTVFPFVLCTLAALGPKIAVDYRHYVFCWKDSREDSKGGEIALSVFARNPATCPPQGATLVDVDKPVRER